MLLLFSLIVQTEGSLVYYDVPYTHQSDPNATMSDVESLIGKSCLTADISYTYFISRVWLFNCYYYEEARRRTLIFSNQPATTSYNAHSSTQCII